MGGCPRSRGLLPEYQEGCLQDGSAPAPAGWLTVRSPCVRIQPVHPRIHRSPMYEAFLRFPPGLLTLPVWAGPGCPLLARTADGQFQPVGQHPAIIGADRALGVAVRGDWQHNAHLAVAVRPDRDAPVGVAGLGCPLRLLHRSAGHREGVVPQGPVAQAELLAEPQLEGERVLAVVGRGNVLQAGGQRRRRVVFGVAAPDQLPRFLIDTKNCGTRGGWAWRLLKVTAPRLLASNVPTDRP